MVGGDVKERCELCSLKKGAFEVSEVNEGRVVATRFPYLGEDFGEVGGISDPFGDGFEFFSTKRVGGVGDGDGSMIGEGGAVAEGRGEVRVVGGRVDRSVERRVIEDSRWDVEAVEAGGAGEGGEWVVCDVEVGVGVGGKLDNVEAIEEKTPAVQEMLRGKEGLRAGGVV